MRAVFDHIEVMPLCNTQDCLHVARKPIEVRGHNGSGPIGNCLLQALGVQVERCGIYVGKYDFESRNPRHFRDDPKGEGRHNNLRPGRELESLQNVKECHAAEGCRNGTAASEVG